MSTHNVCFHGNVKKVQYFSVEKSVLSELCLAKVIPLNIHKIHFGIR